jgi:hypothetical protein
MLPEHWVQIGAGIVGIAIGSVLVMADVIWMAVRDWWRDR